MKRFRFTLIELLIVIAIISILFSMMMPALGKARAMALQTSCANQLKQLGLGMQLYANDYSDYISTNGPGVNTEPWWMGQIAPYIQVEQNSVGYPKVYRKYQCPAYRNPAYQTYNLSGWLTMSGVNNRNRRGNIPDPSNMIILWDSNSGNISLDPSQSVTSINWIHNAPSANFLMLGGNVTTLKYNDKVRSSPWQHCWATWIYQN